MERVQTFRDGGADDRFHDMSFPEMQSDPIGQVRGLYEWLGEPMSPEFEAGMERWWREHAEHREQNVHPDPQAFGLDLDEVAERFAGYRAGMTEWTAARTS